MRCPSGSHIPKIQSQGSPSDNLLQACPSHMLSVMPLFFDLLCLQQRGRSKKSWTLPLISALLCLFFPFFSLFLTIAGEARHRGSSSVATPASCDPNPECCKKALALMPGAVDCWRMPAVVKTKFHGLASQEQYLDSYQGHKGARKHLIML